MKPVRNCRGRLDSIGYILSQCWHREGVALREIGRRLRCCHKTVRRALKRCSREQRHTHRPPPLPTATHGRIKARRKAVKKLAVEKASSAHCQRQFPSCGAIARECRVRGQFFCSSSTVRRDLKFMGFAPRKRQRGPAWVPGDAEKRLSFCRAHQNGGEMILFSDEKFFDTNDHGCMWQWCRNGDRVQRRCESRWATRVGSHRCGCASPCGISRGHCEPTCVQAALLATCAHPDPRTAREQTHVHAGWGTTPRSIQHYAILAFQGGEIAPTLATKKPTIESNRKFMGTVAERRQRQGSRGC